MKVAIAGAGVMGSGIALCSIQAGHETVLYDVFEPSLTKGKAHIEGELKKSVEKGRINQADAEIALSKISYTTHLQDMQADLIIEAALEKLQIKRELFAELEKINSSETIFGTNTSSIPITQIAAGLKHPERVVGIHFFNPAHIMKLVEIISGAATSAEVAQKAFSWAEQLGKKVVYAKDAPGFIVNRVARHFYVEGLKIAEEQAADFQTIDRLCVGSGFKMGPFTLMDLIGVDTNYSVTSSMYEQFQYDSKFRPSRIQKQKVDAGHHGRKSGKGFYNYDK